ncbi:Non-specific serine/threonine protein kinase protein [Dioscorea alata]|uniref:Non-specific serine/threonine protein kinase protein n=2 Tax=Dioscorea alata TaxID=55571 RepID=A0ACB7VFY5_DIOAL|nr:Non-specific serine/threonine protein kinase protein [Dioscorea alata]
MRAFGRRKVFCLLLLCFLSQSLDLGACLNDEGWALLSFRERVEIDPFGVLLNWDEDDMDPCLWFGVDCSDDLRVVALNLRDLCLQGTLAPELGKLIHMKYIILHNNSFSGIIPREITHLQKLEVLDLGYNNLNGPLPSELESIPSLEILILRSNRFLYNVSPKLSELIMLSDLQVEEEFSSNRGSFSRYIGKGPARKLIQVINKHKGSHRRHSQRSRKDHRGIQLIHALLSPSPSPSPVPSVTHSRFSSEAPAPSLFYPPAVSPAPAPSSFATTKPQVNKQPNKTISPSIFTLIPSPAKYPSLGANSDSGAKHTIYWTIYAPAAAGVSFLLTVAAVYILCCRGNKVVTVRPWATGLSGQLQKAFVTGVPSLRRSEIETACEDFSNIVGSLSDCMLYKGTLSSGVEIAVISSMVTSSKDWSKQCEAQFRKKISTLSKVNHKNFVNLLGYCEESEPFTRMMVFEYAPNGTLFEHLHIKEAEHLDWAARLRIAMGIAYCLEHIHQLNPPVLLRNLDSSSIYLTDDYAAKVSDIRFWCEAKESKLASEELAPLDTQGSELENIIYKFGILLLEIISGRLPFCEDNGLLVLWASSYLTGKRPLKEIIDPALESVREEDINALCDIIRSCIHSDITVRPTISQVVGKLREITAMPPDGAVPKLSPLWWAELEIISTEAN